MRGEAVYLLRDRKKIYLLEKQKKKKEKQLSVLINLLFDYRKEREQRLRDLSLYRGVRVRK
jgi:hypothetical protein